MLTVWEPKTSVGTPEDHLEAILPSNERTIEGRYTKQGQPGRRLLTPIALLPLQGDPPDLGEVSGR